MSNIKEQRRKLQAQIEEGIKETREREKKATEKAVIEESKLSAILGEIVKAKQELCSINDSITISNYEIAEQVEALKVAKKGVDMFSQSIETAKEELEKDKQINDAEYRLKLQIIADREEQSRKLTTDSENAVRLMNEKQSEMVRQEESFNKLKYENEKDEERLKALRIKLADDKTDAIAKIAELKKVTDIHAQTQKQINEQTERILIKEKAFKIERRELDQQRELQKERNAELNHREASLSNYEHTPED